MRTIITDARSELGTARYREWAATHPIDASKVALELAGSRRPTAGSPYARLIIEAIRVGLAAEAPPVPLDMTVATRNVMFTAWNPGAALRCPLRWTVALSADPAYDGAVRGAAPALKNRGPIAVWGNQAEVGAERIRKLGAELGALFLIFQAETEAEYTSAIGAGARVIVGNPNSWTQAQRDDATARANRGELSVMFEVYSNMDGTWPDTASSRGVPITTEVLGVGGWEGRPNVQLKDYRPRTSDGVWATAGIYLAEAMSDESWGLLP